VFNNGLEGKEWRAVDILETDQINDNALKELIRAAVRFNRSQLTGETAAPRPPRSSRARKSARTRG